MAKHWSEVLSCRCGKTFRSMTAEAVHRHNFPALCRQKKEPKKCKRQSPASSAPPQQSSPSSSLSSGASYADDVK